jgi:hypothetical protein
MKTTLNFLHHQSTDWLREIEFYKQELTILKNRLGEVSVKNTSTEVAAQVEHFQNKFIMFDEQLDILRHDINQRLSEVDAIVKTKPEHIGEKFNTEEDDVNERVQYQKKSIADTRLEFNKFLSKVM